MRRSFLPIVLFILLPLHAQMRAYQLGFSFSKQDFCDTIDVEIKDGRIFVPVTIGGKTLSFLFDTGSSQGALYNSVEGMQELGNVVSNDANGGKDTVRVVALPHMMIGSLGVSNYVASILPRPEGRITCDGILGFDIINKGLQCKIDTRHSRIILSDRKATFSDEQGYEVKYLLKWFVPHVWISPFKRHQDEALFDTGSRLFYQMNKESFDRHVYKSKQVARQVEGRSRGYLSIGHFGTERPDKVAFIAHERIKWAGYRFVDVHTVTTQGGSRIGCQLLEYGSVTINPDRMRIKFLPYNTGDSVIVSNEQLQIAYVPLDGKPSVGLIWNKSRLYSDGFRQGDIILKINGRDVPSFRFFIDYPFASGEVYSYLVRGLDGKTHEIVSRHK